jgi:uncharacterized membrane protein HdeD (DUF308 family)
MANDFDARDALLAVETDRQRLGDRMTAETHWAAPAQGLAAALLIGAPAAGIPGVFFVIAASMALFIGVEWVFRRRSGLSISRPAGPRGMALLVLLGVLLGVLSALSYGLWVFDLVAWIAPVALLGGVLMAFGVVSYDRMFADEVRRAR